MPCAEIMIGSGIAAVGLVALVVGYGQVAFIERQERRFLRRQVPAHVLLALLAGIRLAVAGSIVLIIATIGIWFGICAMAGFWIGRTISLIATVQWKT